MIAACRQKLTFQIQNISFQCRYIVQFISNQSKGGNSDGQGQWGSNSGNDSNDGSEVETMKQIYKETRKLFEGKKLPPDIDSRTVFACNEVNLGEINVYGFDYDYTLACYKPCLHHLIYNLGRNYLVEKLKYPEDILKLDYAEDFAIRGLHYDIRNGLLMKLDSFAQIQLDAVFRGRTKVPEKEVMELYTNRALPLGYIEGRRGMSHSMDEPNMIHLADLFSVPALCLICNVAQYFDDNSIQYHPGILFEDMTSTISACHPLMHKAVMENIEKYLEKNEKIPNILERLIDDQKKLFLVTNSPYRFVDAGMNYLIGPNWMELFDVIIVQARKPNFFTDVSRPIRLYDEKTHSHVWGRVSKLEKGRIYCEGTVYKLQELTGWKGQSVLYFGDHPYSDLADVSLEHGWRTGAIIKELTHEIETLNKESFKKDVNWLQMLTKLIESTSNVESDAAKELLCTWMGERDELRQVTKEVFNSQFGSVFRTYHNPTYFSRRLFRYAAIYTSDITNLLNYPTNHTFYPRRGVMPHEYFASFL